MSFAGLLKGALWQSCIMNPKKQWLEDYSSSGGQPEGGQGQGQQDKGGGGGGVGAAAAAKETASVNSQQQPQSARPPFARQGSLCSGKCYLLKYYQELNFL